MICCYMIIDMIWFVGRFLTKSRGDIAATQTIHKSRAERAERSGKERKRREEKRTHWPVWSLIVWRSARKFNSTLAALGLMWRYTKPDETRREKTRARVMSCRGCVWSGWCGEVCSAAQHRGILHCTALHTATVFRVRSQDFANW